MLFVKVTVRTIMDEMERDRVTWALIPANNINFTRYMQEATNDNLELARMRLKEINDVNGGGYMTRIKTIENELRVRRRHGRREEKHKCLHG